MHSSRWSVVVALLAAWGMPRPTTAPHTVSYAPPPAPQLETPTASSPRPRPCAANALCLCRNDHLSCSLVPFHRFPETESAVWHVSVSQARLGALAETALDARHLRTLVLVASHLHHLEPGAFAAMDNTLASLDLGYNEFTEIPIEALRDLKVLNWLNLQNNFISEIDPKMDWGYLSESLSSLSLSNNQLCVLAEDALAALRRLAQLELDGNRLHALAVGLPPALALLRISDNLLPRAPCEPLARLPRLSHVHLRNNMLGEGRASNHSCRWDRSRLDSLDLSHNDLDDTFDFEFMNKVELKQLILDSNDFTTIPSLNFESVRLVKLSISHNRLKYLSEGSIHALKQTLERLDVDHNEVEALPGGVREMARLRHLSVAYNRIGELNDLPPHLNSLSAAGNFLTSFPPGLSGLAPATLSYLDLGYNLIAALPADIFGPWADALVTLSLRGNRLSQLAAGVFPSTLPVRELALSFNDLYHVEPSAFANLTSLQVLELSSTLFSGEFPMESFMPQISWLSLDNNNIHHLSHSNMYSFPSLEYLNLDFNKIIELRSEDRSSDRLFNMSCRLKELRLSYNYLTAVNPDFLIHFNELQSVDLSYNRVRNITARSFARLGNLAYLSLAGNVLEFATDKAFCDLPKLEVLDLQENYFTEFATEYFENVSSKEIMLAVNISHNRLTSLVGGSKVFISILDLSYNLLEHLPRSFFDSLGKSLRQVILSHNRLVVIENYDFGTLSNLQILSLNNNNITALKRRAFIGLPSLQILDLSHNKLGQLSVEQFQGARRLRLLRLDANELRALPRDCFANTVLEHLELADNQLTVFPASALARVGFTLRRLGLAHNYLQHLDPAMFHAISFLHELDLARNSLTVLPDNTFAGLSRLMRLDLSYNMIKSNFKELFHNLPGLRRLALAAAGLKIIPHLPLVNLTRLDLSGNYITSYRETDVRRLTNLRSLNIAHNKITSMQPSMWAALPKLTFLDVSHNPLVRVGRGSFEGLGRLLHLRMDNLWKLEAIEPRAFRALTSIRTITLEAPTGEVSPANITASIPGLESLTLYWGTGTLDGQLQELRASKLRALEIRGVALRRVTARAFAALGRQRALSLKLAGTGVRALPPGLLRPLARVPLLALVLVDNRLVTFEPATLYPNVTDWNRLATKLLSGGLIVSGNPLRCGCSVSWVGAWLRRWSVEVGGGEAGARLAARAPTCLGGGAPLPLIALEADEAECHASALSSPAPPAARCSFHLAAFLWIILRHSLS